MTPSEQAALKAEILREIAATRRLWRHEPLRAPTLEAMFECRAAELEAEAARVAELDRLLNSEDDTPIEILPDGTVRPIATTQDRVASGLSPSQATPEPAAKDGDSGGRPEISAYAGQANTFHAEEAVVAWDAHKRLVSWLDADRDKKSKRIVKLETELAMARQEIARLITERDTAREQRDAKERENRELLRSVANADERDRRQAATIAKRERELAEALSRKADNPTIGAEWSAAVLRAANAEGRAEKAEADLISARERHQEASLTGQNQYEELHDRLAKAEADAAVLRQALEAFGEHQSCFAPCPRECERGNLPDHMATCRRRAGALATGAGEKLLAEVKKMRAFVAAFDRWQSPYDGGSPSDTDKLLRARAALGPPSPGCGGQDGGAL